MQPRVIDTKITDCWVVEWTPGEIARDFLQNFYDANTVEDIKIVNEADTVTVSAPAEFDADELLYMGSDKGEDAIGKYGEGFKAATLNAMRNHHCQVEVWVKNKRLEWFFESRKIGRSEKKVVMCRISAAEEINGTRLILKKCPSVLIEEFQFGLNHFYYEANPLLGELLAETPQGDIRIYKSNKKSGYAFYKKLLRAELDVPLAFVCNRSYQNIEAKIAHDRDRKAFNENVLEIFLARVGKRFPEQLPDLVNLLQPWWGQGHKVLSIFARSARYNFSMDFPENYYARSSKDNNHHLDEMAKIQLQEEEFKKAGYIACPGYMSELGMKTAASVVKERETKIRDEYAQNHTRSPNAIEGQALLILSRAVEGISSNFASLFRNVQYTIGDSDSILGELKEARGWREQHVYLSEKIFTMDFCEALSILLHEWSHLHGYDGSRSFTDALTAVIASVIKHRTVLDSYEREWEEITSEIKNKTGSSAHDLVDRLDTAATSKLLRSIPEDQLMVFLEKTGLV